MNNPQIIVKNAPFKRFCMTIGAIPTSYLDSLDYYETLLWLIKYLEETIIPTVNNNGEAVSELQTLYTELKNYVDNYFTNLDVQEEINNKLDEMVEDGTLEHILLNYVNTIKVFDTDEDIDNTTLVNGMNIKTLGEKEVNDGNGANYKINENGIGEDIGNGLFKQLINNFQENYYENITYNKVRYLDTDCYILEIPKYDKNNNLINLYCEYSTLYTPTEYARKNFTNITTNGSISVDAEYNEYPTIISNGEIINNFTEFNRIPSYSYYLGITNEREFKTYPYNTYANTMLSDGCINVLLTFGKCVDDAQIVEATYGNALVKNPRMALGILENENIILFACDGRIGNNAGLTVEEMSNYLLSIGCIDVWNLDGGGSTSLTYKGTKLNKNIDNNGTEDRFMKCTLNIKKQTKNIQNAEAFSQIGFVKQLIMNEVFSSFISNDLLDISNTDLNNFIGKFQIGYGNELINSYKNRNGWVINIPHSYNQYKNLYNLQLFADRDRSYIYMRRMINGVWCLWEIISATNKKSFAVAENYSPSADNTYEKLKFTQVQDQTDIISLVDPQPSNDYTTFKIDRIGYCTIKIQGEIGINDNTGNRFIRVYQNDNTAGLNTTSFTPTSGRNLVNKEVYFYNDNKDNLYTIGYNGKTTDSFRSFSVIVETD